jgi:hypothetical protein
MAVGVALALDDAVFALDAHATKTGRTAAPSEIPKTKRLVVTTAPRVERITSRKFVHWR